MESALESIRLFEDLGFEAIKISLKSSNVMHTIAAYELLSRESDYPLHVGVTEAGTLISGTVKNAIGIGILLFNGIGDTFRVSLCCDPVEEVKVAYEILRALDLRHRGPEFISCPTCGRCEIDLFIYGVNGIGPNTKFRYGCPVMTGCADICDLAIRINSCHHTNQCKCNK